MQDWAFIFFSALSWHVGARSAEKKNIETTSLLSYFFFFANITHFVCRPTAAKINSLRKLAANSKGGSWKDDPRVERGCRRFLL